MILLVMAIMSTVTGNRCVKLAVSLLISSKMLLCLLRWWLWMLNAVLQMRTLSTELCLIAIAISSWIGIDIVIPRILLLILATIAIGINNIGIYIAIFCVQNQCRHRRRIRCFCHIPFTN